MKKLILILLIISPIYMFGQVKVASKKPSFYLVDNKEVTIDSLYKVDPKTVMEAQTLNGATATKLYGTKASDGAIIIVTFKFARWAYEKLFSTFSNDLKDYYAEHGSDDSGVVYILNGLDITKNQTKVSKLFDIMPNEITSISFLKNDVNGATVHINVKSIK